LKIMEQEHGRTFITRKLVDSLYVEAMVLADEARSYFDSEATADREAMAPDLRVHFACESLRVTTRLMHVIAWLLTQRAVAAGEITAADATKPDRRLGEAPESDQLLARAFPAAARELIQTSQELYDRVRRLDRLSGQPAQPFSPARTLLNRIERSF
jgi:regulator of CtrA degradation